MTAFDPEQKREHLRASHGIALKRKLTLEEARANGALAHAGFMILLTSIKCFVVGFFDEGKELAQKGVLFIQTELDETGQADIEIQPGALASHWSTLALGKWLAKGEHDASAWKLAAEFRDRYFAEQRRPDKTDVQLSLTPYVEAQHNRILIERYESAGLKRPSSLRKVQGEGTMCYEIARHRLGEAHSADELAEGMQRFLHRRIPNWLDDGVVHSAAQWMKIAHWQPGQDPIQTLLRCYDYLPDLVAPPYQPAKN